MDPSLATEIVVRPYMYYVAIYVQDVIPTQTLQVPSTYLPTYLPTYLSTYYTNQFIINLYPHHQSFARQVAETAE